MKRIIVFFLLLCTYPLAAQVETKGTDFWVSFANNASGIVASIILQIRVVADVPTTGTITFTGISGPAGTVPFSIAANSIFTHTLSVDEKTASYNLTSGTYSSSVHIQTDVPVSVFAFNTYAALADATNLLPAPLLGTDYYHLGRTSYPWSTSQYDQYMVIATENGTIVQENGTQVATLSAGQVYFRQAAYNQDMSGIHITSNNPIAYFTCHNYCVNQGGGDNLFQQLSPVNTWGRNFLVPVSNRTLELVRIVASQNNTLIKQTGGSGSSTFTLNEGQWVELTAYLSNNGCFIEADKPVQVCSYMVGQSYSGAVTPYGSDEAICWIPPIEQSVGSALMAPFAVNSLYTHFAMIVTPTATKGNTIMSVGGAAETGLSGGIWYDNVASGMSFYSVQLSNTTSSYVFKNPYGMIVYGYGFGNFISYYYMAASAMRTLDVAFYVDEIHNQDLEFHTICTQPMDFRAEILGDLSPNPGYLEWWINGVEQVAVRDTMAWSTSLPSGAYQVKIVARMDNEVTTKTAEGTLIVASLAPPPVSPSGLVTVCLPETGVQLSTVGDSCRWFKDGIEIPDSTAHTYTATTSGDYSVMLLFEECNSAMSDTVTVLIGGFIQAYNDYSVAVTGLPQRMAILDNDSLGCCGRSGISGLSVVSGKNGKHGTAVIAGDTMIYTSVNNYYGIDSVTYQYSCYGVTTTAVVYIQVVNYHDNVIDATGCVIPFEPIAFSIKRKWFSANGTADNYTGALVGDLDNDGIPEIVTISSSRDRVYILDGSTGLKKDSILVPAYINPIPSGGWMPVSIGLLVDSDMNGRGELIIADDSRNLTSYEAVVTAGVFSMNLKWQTTYNSAAPTPSGDNNPQMIVADFNGDGVPELAVYDQIFNARTGAKLGVLEPDPDFAYTGRIRNRAGNNTANFYTAVDFDNDGLPEIAAGGKIYKVDIDPSGSVATCSILYQTGELSDGFTSVADVDLDGKPDVVVVDYEGGLTRINIWYPTTGLVQHIPIPNSDTYQGYPFIGDIDGLVETGGKRYPEICVTTRRLVPSIQGRVSAYRYDAATQSFVPKWELINSDTSGGTGITLFDFNNDGVSELVYRDQNHIYILDGSANTTPTTLSSFVCTSGTAFEYPVIADLDGSGSAQICVTCLTNDVTGITNTLNAFESATTPWSPTRKVWNQVHYQVTGINNDLTVPTRMFPKTYRFDVGANHYWPYNGALIQAPVFDNQLHPIVRSADPYIQRITPEFLDDVTIRVTVVIGNQGLMNTNPSLPIAFYNGLIAPANLYSTQPIGVALKPGNTVTFVFNIPITQTVHLFSVRIQDDGTNYPVIGSYNDCDYSNNTKAAVVPLLMQKDAILNGTLAHNGYPSNPVATLFSDVIEYTITAVNANINNNTTVIIRDTLPPYLHYVSAVPPYFAIDSTTTAPRTWIEWRIPNLASLDTTAVAVKVTPHAGVSASQPLFKNRAWATVSDTVVIPTNYTYHQGVGVSIVTFSAGYGGSIYHAVEQALDFGITPRAGVLVVPDEGYRFVGWSHPDYLSMRGETIKAESGIMLYDTLLIFGDVNLHARFDLETYPITYRQIPDIQPDKPSYTDRIWAAGNELFVQTSKPGSIVRIYFLNGVMMKQQLVLRAGEMTIQLPKGLYIVTLNNSIGQKINVK